MPSTVILIPTLAGTRQSASKVSSDATFEASVTLDFSQCLSAAQGFCDELTKQLLERSVTRIALVGANDRTRQHIERSLQLRDDRGLTEVSS